MDLIKTSIAGGVAGCAAKTIVAPLDRVKILFQTNNPRFIKFTGSFLGIFNAANTIRRESGLRGLLQGHSATLLRIYPYAAIKFTANEHLKRILMPTSQLSQSWIRHFIAGSLAGKLNLPMFFTGVAAVFVSYPLEMIRVRMAYEISNAQPISYSRTVLQIYSEQSPFFASQNLFSGFSNFYRGFLPTIIGMIPYAGVSFATYDSVKRFLMDNQALAPFVYNKRKPPLEGKKAHLRGSAELLCGGIAGWAGQTVSYPLEIIRRQMQVAGIRENSGERPHLSIQATIREIYSLRGYRGFFIGLTIGYIKVIPMSAVSFFVYEGMKRSLSI